MSGMLIDPLSYKKVRMILSLDETVFLPSLINSWFEGTNISWGMSVPKRFVCHRALNKIIQLLFSALWLFAKEILASYKIAAVTMIVNNEKNNILIEWMKI